MAKIIEKILPLVGARRELGARAPVQEAIFDVQVRAPSATMNMLQGFANKFKTADTQVEEINAAAFHVQFQNGAASMGSTSQKAGFQLLDKNRRFVVQARVDGFTFSKLAPYEDFDRFQADAQVHWEGFAALLGEFEIGRVALRYVNRISLPAGRLELADWFSIRPDVPDGIGDMTDFLTRFRMVHPISKDYAAVVLIGSAPSSSPKEYNFIFDIDTVYQGPVQRAQIVPIVENLREYKNDIFFGGLTGRTLEEISK